MSSSTTVINTIDQYIPSTLKRSLNKQYYLDNNKEYCQLASHIYNDDMLYILNNADIYVIYYYNEDYQLEACLNVKDVKYFYKIKQYDDYYILTIKNKYKDVKSNNLVDIDLQSQFKILKNRGCEDYEKKFAKKHTIDSLKKTFKNYFNPDNIHDMIYLYVFLHSNSILVNKGQINTSKRKFKINKLPKEDFLKDIYDLYNLLYVYFDVLQS